MNFTAAVPLIIYNIVCGKKVSAAAIIIFARRLYFGINRKVYILYCRPLGETTFSPPASRGPWLLLVINVSQPRMGFVRFLESDSVILLILNRLRNNNNCMYTI